MLSKLKSIEFTPAVISLIAMNLLPLIGVFYFGWDAGTIVFLYWLENVVIGVLNIPKIYSSREDEAQPKKPRAKRGKYHYVVSDGSRDKRSRGGLVFLCVFFSFHYGMFCFGHYMFLKSTYRDLPDLNEMFAALTGPVLFWSLLGLTISHIVSMIVNFYGKGEYKTRSASAQMFMPYTRIVVLHVVIILSGFIALAAGQSIATLLLLVVFKIGFDLAAHVVEHSDKDSFINPGVG